MIMRHSLLLSTFKGSPIIKERFLITQWCKMKTKFILLIIFITVTLSAQETIQSFISLKNTGVQEFLEKHPEYDGRGTIVMILDTGIDMGIDGLTKTSTGEDKVIDVQDFTGQGDVQLFDATIENENDSSFFVNSEKDYKVAGADKLSLKAKDDKYYIGLVTEKRWMNSGSRVRDLNGNGTTDDKFYIVAFETESDSESYWVAYFDANSDGDISDDQPNRNYKEKHDVIKIKNETGLTYFTIALNIFPKEKKVVLFFDDGSHGTHCAGIAAGYSIGKTSLNGVAPGAYLMGLKLGNNTLSGGATVTGSMKRAYLYADKISKEREEPCIINMSFGIGSEIEGRADFEIFLADLVRDNPYLYIATSNGNEGPGISTTGLPAASTSVLSSGAVLAQEIGNDLYGTVLDRDIILHFSSRGGEVPKPDVVSPGAATSTVPNFAGGDRYWGTSMASPYSAGVLSLLLSAAKVEFPDVKIPSRLLYKVLRESAVPMEGYVKIDQGGGLINVVNAFELLKKYIAAGEISKFENYTISAFAPNMPDEISSSMYVRNGSYLTGDENFSFSVIKDDNNTTNTFYRLFNLKSDSDWLIPISKQTRIRNDHSATINYRLDKSKMTDFGMYNGTITAYDSKTNTPAFEMMATVVLPYQFTSENNYSLTWKD
ncbi:Peptidase S8 and S53, subtilisin, kexin, sedolisin, partial [hydrothermal vent metagenome]